MGLKITLKPHERLIIGGAVVANFLVQPAIASQIESFRSMWPERTIRSAGHLNGA
ncbi:MAG: hypothetical protein HGB21_02455, partial [Nitrospirae bacterium]|nr:hypothetical protein [Nitrospirota bacterium]